MVLTPRLSLVVIVLTLLASCASNRALPDSPLISKIAFGSCADQHVSQPIWETIGATRADVFVLVGDAIYADYDGSKLVEVSAESLTRDWAALQAEPHFAKFRQSTQLLGTWDNHDYGTHNGGAEFPLKTVSQDAFLDFLNEAEDSIRRSTPGIYDAQTLGPDGRRIQVILLDTRFFRSRPKLNSGSADERKRAGLTGTLDAYQPNNDSRSTILGEDQWSWLDQELQEPAELRLIVSSIQVIPDEKRMDEWGNFPRERTRLIERLAAVESGKVLILSGNVHFAEISAIEHGDRQILEFTSSGLTHTNVSYAKASNSYRVAGPYADLNYGVVEVDWYATPSPTVSLSAIRLDGEPAFVYETSLD